MGPQPYPVRWAFALALCAACAAPVVGPPGPPRATLGSPRMLDLEHDEPPSAVHAAGDGAAGGAYGGEPGGDARGEAGVDDAVADADADQEPVGDDEAGPIGDPDAPHFAPMQSRWYGPGNPAKLGGLDIDIEPAEYGEVNRRAHPLNPYRQNRYKGDFPILGTQDLFLAISGTSRTLVQSRRLPTPSGLAGPVPVQPDFFGESKQEFFNQDFVLSFDLFKGQQAFKPVQWRLRLSPVFNYNRLAVEEKGVTNIDLTRRRTRERTDFALQEAFFEYHLYDWNDRYDFLTSEIGILPFRSDFRGFIFDDVNLGVRLLGNADNNKWQYNLAVFDMLDKDTNSLLNEFEDREQVVVIANVYRQDWPTLGYISSLSFHYNHDERGEHFDDNGVLVSPAPAGFATQGKLDAYYLGWAGEGHFGRINITHALYQVFGEQENNAFAGQDVDLNAQFAALELSYDLDWWRVRAYGMYASGDDDTRDDDGEGFDAIMDAPNFAGGEFSFFNAQAIRLLGVNLTNAFSPLPDLQTSKFEGQANFVNPGLELIGAAVQAEITPTLRAQTGINYMRFNHAESLETFLELPDVEREIGLEYFLGAQYRPLLTNNVIFNVGASALVPGDGIERIYQDDETMYSIFLQMLITW